jgi:hypothetical protein
MKCYIRKGNKGTDMPRGKDGKGVVLSNSNMKL